MQSRIRTKYALNVQNKGSWPAAAFGTRVGRGLHIGTLDKPARSHGHAELVGCPPVLELRQLLQYQPISQQTREKLVAL